MITTRPTRPAPRRARSPRWLDGLSAVCAVGALVLLVLPSVSLVGLNAQREADGALPVTPAPTATLPTTTSLPVAGADSVMRVVVNGNVFSSTRRAPVTRFVVPGSLTPDAPATAAMPSNAGSNEDDALPRLSGIIAMNGERRALLQFATQDGAPRLYRVNDVHAGYRVVRIDMDRVILASATGTRTLRLSSRATPDSLRKLP